MTVVTDAMSLAMVTDPIALAMVTDPIALARVTDALANEESNQPFVTSGIVSDRAAAEIMTSTEADSDGHDRSEILSKDAILERAAAGHSTSTGARTDGHDQPRTNESVAVRATSGVSTSTGADADRDDLRMTTGAGAVHLRTSVEHWRAGLRAGTPTSTTYDGPKDRPEDHTTLLAGQLAATSETSSVTSQQWVYDETKDIEVNGPQWTSSIV